MPECVIETMSDFYAHGKANIHRGVYRLSQQATDRYEAARKRVAQFIGAKGDEIIFTSGTTASINLFATSWSSCYLKKGDTIIVTAMEHHGNFVPWQQMCQAYEAHLVVWPMNGNGDLDPQFQIPEGAKLLALTHVSNTIGTINPLRKIVKLAKEKGLVVMVDGAQALAHTRVHVEKLGVDAYAFSGHKLFGPTGIGVLFVKESLMVTLPPYQTGGGMIQTVSQTQTTFAEAPRRFEAGTPHIAGAIGLARAIDYIESFDRKDIELHERELFTYARAQLQTILGVQLIGSPKKQAPILSFVVTGLHPHDVGTVLDATGVAIRTGHHCTQPLLAHFGVPATCRVSFSFYNTKEDVDRLTRGIKKAQQILCP